MKLIPHDKKFKIISHFLFNTVNMVRNYDLFASPIHPVFNAFMSVMFNEDNLFDYSRVVLVPQRSRERLDALVSCLRSYIAVRPKYRELRPSPETGKVKSGRWHQCRQFAK